MSSSPIDKYLKPERPTFGFEEIILLTAPARRNIFDVETDLQAATVKVVMLTRPHPGKGDHFIFDNYNKRT
jgi:hypothetical protein